MKPVEITIIMRNKAKEGLKEISVDIDALKADTESTVSVIKALETQLASLEKLTQSATPEMDQTANIAMIEALKSKISELKEELKGVENQTNNTRIVPPDLPGAQRQYNGLHMSIQQIAREMPTLAMGPQMFFLAISNNLPIFTDELARARKEYEATTAAGMKGTAVWKQVLKSIFSWQTAMTTLIMLSVMYGAEVWEWTKNLFGAETAIRRIINAEQQMALARTKSVSSSTEEIAKLKLLYKASQDESRSKKERISAIRQLKEKYPEYFSSLSNESILAGNAATAYENLSKQILASAKARAYSDTIADNEKKILDLDTKRANAIVTRDKAKEKYDRLSKQSQELAGTEAGDSYAAWASAAKDKWDKAQNSLDNIISQQETYRKNNERLSKEINMVDLDWSSDNEDKGNKPDNKIADYRIEAERRVQEQIVALTTEGIAKKKSLAELEYQEELARIDKEEKAMLEHYRKLQKAGVDVDPVEVQTVTANYKVQRNNAGEIYNGKIKTIDNEAAKDANKKLKEEMLSWDEYLVQYGNFMQKKEALQNMYNLKISNAKTKGERASLQKELEEKMKGLKFDELKSNIDFSQVFGNLDNLTTSSLSSLRDKLKNYINSAAKDLKPEDLKELSDAFLKIDIKVAERDPFTELKASMDEYKSAVNAVNKAQQDLADVQEGRAIVVGSKYDAVNNKIIPVLLTEKQAEENLLKAQNKRAETQEKINTSFHSGVSKAREYVDAAGAVLDTLESFGVEVPEELSGVIDGLGQTLDSLASIDVTKPMSIITGAIGAIGGIGSAIGGLFGKSHEVSQKTIDQYNRLIDTLDDVIAKHKEMLREMAGSDAQGEYEKTQKMIEKEIAASQKMGTEYLNSSAKRSHSYGYKLYKKLKGYAADFNDLGIDFDSLGIRMDGLFKLSPEQLSTIKEQLPEAWAKIDDKTREYLENIIAGGEAMNDLKETADEALTGITFESARDSLKSLLLDAKTTMADVADSFQDYMRQAIVSVIIDKNLKGQIEKWYGQFSEAMSDGTLSDKEREDLQQLYQDIFNDATTMRDNAYAAAGITDSESSEQSGQAGAVTTITEDTASKLEGIARSMQDHLVGMDEKMDSITQVAYDSFDKLSEINENTRYCRNLEQIANDIAEIKRDGLPLN